MLLEKLCRDRWLTTREYAELLASPQVREARRLADRVRRERFDTRVYLRGLIDMGSICPYDCPHCRQRSSADCTRYRMRPRDGILRANFGVGLDDVTIPDEWLYLQDEDFYCSNHNDAYFPSPFTITAVEDDGVNIRIYYNIEGYFNLETEEFLDCAELVLCLERLENGTIHAVSNIIAH